MFKKKFNRKGFTILELVLVIAIVATLAAVLIPTFINLTKKAKENADTQLVRNLNTALATDKALSGEHATMQSALDAAESFGYSVDKINASATDNEILWDSVNDCFVYLKDDTLTYIPESKTVEDVKDYQLWQITDELPTLENQKYSIYAGNDWTAATVDVKVGFDAGKSTIISEVNYTNTSVDGHNVAIRTNSYETVLSVNAPSDIVKHYDEANKVNIIAVAPSSYHEYGEIQGNIILTNGRVVAESGSSASAIIIETTATGITSGTVIISADNTKVPNIPIIIQADVKEAIDAVTASNPSSGNKISVGKNDKGEESIIEVNENAYVAVNNNVFNDLITAWATIEDGDIVRLLKNVEYNSTLTLDNDKKIILDLGGFTLNCKGNDSYYGFKIDGGHLTITNGTFLCESKYGRPIGIYGQSTDPSNHNYSSLKIAETATINSPYGVYVLGKTYSTGNAQIAYGVIVDIYGTVIGRNFGGGSNPYEDIEYGGTCVFVSGNIGGDETSCNLMTNNMPIINIYSSALLTATDTAGDIDGSNVICENGLATVNVYGGHLEGADGIMVKRGFVNVYGGEIIANGAYLDVENIEAIMSGSDETHSAIGVTSTYNYAGAIGINLYGGRLESKNSYALIVTATVYNSKVVEFRSGAVGVRIEDEAILIGAKGQVYNQGDVTEVE